MTSATSSAIAARATVFQKLRIRTVRRAPATFFGPDVGTSCICFFALASPHFGRVLLAQYPGLTLPPSGNNQKAAATQFIGPVRITIEYSSPAVHGPDGKDRRGQIWGKLVPYGLTNLGFGNGKPDPWRAGANENTVFTVSERRADRRQAAARRALRPAHDPRPRGMDRHLLEERRRLGQLLLR